MFLLRLSGSLVFGHCPVLNPVLQDEGDSLEAKSDEPSCGSTFRDIYATEVVNAVVNILARALEGDLADVGHSHRYPHSINVQCALVCSPKPPFL